MVKSKNTVVQKAIMACMNATKPERGKGQQGETRWVTIGHSPVLVDKDGNPVRDNEAAKAARKKDFPYESDESKWPALPTEEQMSKQAYKEFKAVTKKRLDNAINKAWCEGVDVPDAATVWYKERKPNGSTQTIMIDIDIGREDLKGIGGNGLIHVASDHDEKMIKKISNILTYGKYYHDEFENGAYLVTLGKDVLSLKQKRNGKYRIASSYEADEKVKRYFLRGGQVLNRKVVEGEWTGGF